MAECYILITFAEKPSHAYPLATVICDPEGNKISQETQSASIRDCRMHANGIATGIAYATNKHPNILVDQRLQEVVK